MEITFLAILLYFNLIYVVGGYLAGYFTKEKVAFTKDYTSRPMVTIMLSCYNEGETIYKTIQSLISSNYPIELIQILAFDDYSTDDSFNWMLKAAQEFPQVLVHRNTENLGKGVTLTHAAKIASGDIIIITDSDCIFDPNAVSELVACFKEPKIGAVGGVIGIYNTNESLLTQMQAIVYSLNFHFLKSMENIKGTVQCLGGPLVAIRKQIYLDIIPAIRNKNFLGEKITVGEDRFITQQVMLKGYKTFVNLKSKCWVSTPANWNNFFKQQLRWRRSALGQWIVTLVNLRKYIRKAGLIATILSIWPITSNLIVLLFIAYLLTTGSFLSFWVYTIVINTIIAPIFGLLFNYYMGKSDLSYKVVNPMAASYLIIIWRGISALLVTPWAMWTLDDGGWITRQQDIIERN